QILRDITEDLAEIERSLEIRPIQRKQHAPRRQSEFRSDRVADILKAVRWIRFELLELVAKIMGEIEHSADAHVQERDLVVEESKAAQIAQITDDVLQRRD